MVRRSFRIGLRLGLLFGVTFALVKTVQSRRSPAVAPPPPAPWEPIVDEPTFTDEVGEPILEPTAPELAETPELAEPDVEEPVVDTPEPADPPAPAQTPAKKPRARRGPTAKKMATPAWVEAEGGACPTTHPIKAKLKSRLFHLPGMFAYDRTSPDRCYRDADAAVADGFTSAKR